MNALSDDDVPALWLQLQERHPGWLEPSFTHLEVALAPRIAAVPATQENGAGNRLMPQRGGNWHQLDPTAFSQPSYRAPQKTIDEEMRRQCFDWKKDAGLTTTPNRTGRAETRPEEECATSAPEGAAALLAACIRGDQQAVRALLWEGEEVNVRDHHGLTALDHALDHKQFIIAEILAAAGAVWTRPRNDVTAMLIPAVSANLPNLLRYALDAGADITVTDRDGRMPLHHAVLGMRHAFLPCLANLRTAAHADALGNTPLHLAVLAGNEPALKALLVWRAALNARNQDGSTALSCACALPYVNSVMLFMRAGADITLENRFGQHPLHVACLHGQAEIVRMLLAHGADPHGRTGDGETALGIAQRMNIPAIVSALMLAGATN
ncbi:ankyrin repeat domain-containing protein [Noviherbaspirillum soli]|uniref:ankyrin repeat domain-containing protein n=1 Tax=Noviherbaspirillum soli TaxID=1064518 RepID=UPI00188AB0ED|nr:ankyrin repeat domain-containing protein [Noviherbaspirillum soli]